MAHAWAVYGYTSSPAELGPFFTEPRSKVHSFFEDIFAILCTYATHFHLHAGPRSALGISHNRVAKFKHYGA